MLHLQVSDTGPGLNSAHDSPAPGVGLSNTRARLAQLYGQEHRFELANGTSKGLQVDVHIPFAVGSPASSSET
jgi:LytS/YehU family sensor histidine kinase